MAIITKPVGGVLKGVPATFTLSKVELLAVPMVAADSYFSDSDNWNKVILKYKSSEGKQYEIVEFNATQSSPTGTFSVSEKARDEFEIQTLEIIDFDGGIFIVPRGVLTTAEFDIDFTAAGNFLENSVVWNVNVNGHTLGSNGSASKLTPDGTLTMLNASSGFSGNFELQYTFNFSDTEFNYFAVGLSNNSGLDSAIHFYRTSASSNWKIWKSFDRITIPNADFNQSEPNTITFIRSGTDVQVLLNGVLKYTFTGESQMLYPGTRLAGSITSATYEIP